MSSSNFTSRHMQWSSTSSSQHQYRQHEPRFTLHPSIHMQPQQHQQTILLSTRLHATASSGGQQPPSQQQQETFADVMSNILSALSGGQPPPPPSGANLYVSNLCYQPPGAPLELLRNVDLSLAPNKLGLVFGRSGSGKTTLLQLIAGLAQQTSGSIKFNGSISPATNNNSTGGLSMQQRMASAGLVFQFPERHFVGATLAEELTAGWPTTPDSLMIRQQLTTRTYQVLDAVGLQTLPLDIPLSQLSDGYKRRVALAVQLVRRPSLLLLDEPLAGLDWRTRGELVRLLEVIKKECTVLVVSHDLRELAPLVDASWMMRPGGKLEASELPTATASSSSE